MNNTQLYRAFNSPDLILGFYQYGNCHQIATATGFNAPEVMLKARMEGFERRVSSTPPAIAAYDSANSIKKKGSDYVDPDEFVPLLDFQRKAHNLKPFKRDKKYRWVQGFSWETKSPVYVPVDLVYYDFQSRDRLYYANSSGVAAHYDRNAAVRAAFLELVERDAIMRSWFTKKGLVEIRFDEDEENYESYYADFFINRQKKWKSFRRELNVFYLNSVSGTATFLATITGSSWPHFVCGASATMCEGLYSYAAAAKKAIEEAEANFEAYFGVNNASNMCEKNCYSPSDHAIMYCSDNNLSHIFYLYERKPKTRLDRLSVADTTEVNLEKMLHEYSCVVVDMTPECSSRQVMRVLSPKLLPISFGHKLAHFTHKSLYGYDVRETTFPHFFP